MSRQRMSAAASLRGGSGMIILSAQPHRKFLRLMRGTVQPLSEVVGYGRRAPRGDDYMNMMLLESKVAPIYFDSWDSTCRSAAAER